MIEQSLEVLQAPGYFLAGIVASKQYILKMISNIDNGTTLIINLDDSNIIWPSESAPLIPHYQKYISSLQKYCSSKRKEMKLQRKSSDVLIIPKNTTDDETKSLFPKLNKIVEIVDTIMELNYKIFIEGIPINVLANQNKEEMSSAYCKKLGHDENTHTFIDEFIETQTLLEYCPDIKES